jgi:pilus assembly protein CpaF
MSSHTRIIAVQSAKGGVGCSITANNLAISMVYETKKPVCLIELDVIRGGCQAGLLNIDHEISKQKNIKTLFDQGQVTKETFLKSLIKHKTGLSLLSSNTSEELESLSTQQVIDILSTAGSIFENIVVDLSQPFISEELMTTFDFASSVFMVITPDIITFEHTQKFLDLMKDLNFPASKFQVILNMSGISSTELDLDTIQSYMGRKVLAKIPYNVESFITSVNTGIPLLQSGSNQDVNRTFLELAKISTKINPTNLNNAISSALENAQKFNSNESSDEEKSNNHHTQQHHHVPQPQKTNHGQNMYGLDKEVYKNIKSITHKALISEMRLDKLTHIDLNDPVKKAELKGAIIEKIGTIFDQQGFQIPGRAERSELIKDIADEALGFGPLEDLLNDPDVTEVMVNGMDKIYVEKKGRLTLSTRTFTDEKQLRVVIDRIVAPIGRRIDESSPYVDARLPDGSRVNIVIPPLAIDGASITIRRFPTKRLIIEDFVQYGTLTAEMADFLASCVAAKMNIFISGGTGSGKTTLLNILSSFIPNDERIVTIEDAAELRLIQDHIVRLESRPANIEGKGAVTIRDLVKNSLRMRPDRVVIGEIRGGEALDMLQAMNTGHDGSLATGHANTPRDALARIETMVLMAGMDLPVRAIREQIASAINIIVQQSRMRDGSRKITKIVEITGMEGDIISTQDIFSYELKGIDENGKTMGKFTTTNIRPKVVDVFEGRGIKVPDVFSPQTILAKMNAKAN